MVDYKAMGARIRVVRKEKRISQEKLAEMVGVCTTHISHIETGNTVPSIATLVQIANVLEVTADELLCDSLLKSGEIFGKIYMKELQDCSDKEAMVIAEVASVVKKAFRKAKSIDE